MDLNINLQNRIVSLYIAHIMVVERLEVVLVDVEVQPKILSKIAAAHGSVPRNGSFHPPSESQICQDGWKIKKNILAKINTFCKVVKTN